MDAEIDSGFTLCYNIFRDEFFGEFRIAGVPTVTYEFDAKTIADLEGKLSGKLERELKRIRKAAAG